MGIEAAMDDAQIYEKARHIMAEAAENGAHIVAWAQQQDPWWKLDADATAVSAAVLMLHSMDNMSRADLTLAAFDADSLRSYLASRVLKGRQQKGDT